MTNTDKNVAFVRTMFEKETWDDNTESIRSKIERIMHKMRTDYIIDQTDCIESFILKRFDSMFFKDQALEKQIAKEIIEFYFNYCTASYNSRYYLKTKVDNTIHMLLRYELFKEAISISRRHEDLSIKWRLLNIVEYWTNVATNEEQQLKEIIQEELGRKSFFRDMYWSFFYCSENDNDDYDEVDLINRKPKPTLVIYKSIIKEIKEGIEIIKSSKISHIKHKFAKNLCRTGERFLYELASDRHGTDYLEYSMGDAPLTWEKTLDIYVEGIMQFDIFIGGGNLFKRRAFQYLNSVLLGLSYSYYHASRDQSLFPGNLHRDYISYDGVRVLGNKRYFFTGFEIDSAIKLITEYKKRIKLLTPEIVESEEIPLKIKNKLPTEFRLFRSGYYAI